MSIDTQYAFAVAKVRTLEGKLLDKGKIDRMVDAKSADEALKVIIDADYGYSSGDITDADEYETLLIEEQKKVYRLLKEVAPQPDVFDLFLLRNDFHNVKVILKSEFLGQINDDMLVETGTIAPGKLKIMVKDRNFRDMPSIMKDAVFEVIDTFNRTRDPQVIDLILDKAVFAQMKQVAQSSKNEFINDLVRIQVDLANIKTFVRVKRMNKSWDFLNKALLPGGRIDNKIYIEKLEEPIDSFVDTLAYTAYGKVCDEGLEDYKKTGSLTRLEKLSDNYVLGFIKKAKYIALGIEPLIAYLMAKENEIKNVRIIMVGKINKISTEIIRERLRESYV